MKKPYSIDMPNASKILKLIKLRYFYPFLYAIYAIIFIYSSNMSQLKLTDIFIPVVYSIVFTAVILLILRVLIADSEKVMVLASIFLILFFNFLRLSRLLSEAKLGDIILGRYRYFLPVWLITLLLITYLVIKSRHKFQVVGKFLSILSVLLIVITSLSAFFQHYNLVKNTENNDVKKLLKPLRDQGRKPDIYYIILDSYARSDVFREKYSYDNREFLSRLKEKGFYIAEESHTNYSFTYHSLSSSLNLAYINDIISRINTGGGDQEIVAVLSELITNNRVAESLQQIGYKYVFINTGLLYWRAPEDALVYNVGLSSLTYLKIQTLNSTPVHALSIVLGRRNFPIPAHANHRNGILLAFKLIEEMPENKEPTFVFAHILAPHLPFVFDENGSDVADRFVMSLDIGNFTKYERIKLYREQSIFITRLVERTIDNVLAKSTERPIIILQSDHGPESFASDRERDFRERMAILNAYYLPNGNSGNLYKSISPVNTFRLIFNEYFGTNYDFLEDRHYFSSNYSKLTDVTQNLH